MKSDIEVFYSGESFLADIMQGNQFDLIYLDIEMDQINGIEVGRQIRKEMKDYTTEIVYVSGKDEYDRQLFEVQPLHFIPKPIASNIVIDDLKLALERSKKLHRSYLINFNHISIFRYDEVVMSNGDILPISQSRRKAIREIQVGRE